MKKLDLIRQEKSYYEAKTAPRLVRLKEYKYLTIEGISAPEDPLFGEALSAIYAVAYAIKFYCKSENRDFVVPKMEGQWWVEGPLPFEKTPRDQWHWKLLIPLPNFVTPTLFNQMREQAANKKKINSI